MPRQIGPATTAMVSRLCINVGGISYGVNESTTYARLTQSFYSFSAINVYMFCSCNEPSEISSHVDEALKELFGALRRHSESPPKLTSLLEIPGEPTLVQMVDALVQGMRKGHIPNVLGIWKQRVVDPELLEVYYKNRPLYWLAWTDARVAPITAKPAIKWLNSQSVLIQGSRSKMLQACRQLTVPALMRRWSCSTGAL